MPAGEKKCVTRPRGAKETMRIINPGNLQKRSSSLSEIESVFRDAKRKGPWFFGHLTPRKFGHLALNTLSFLTKRETLVSWPSILKIDVSPLCHLHCTVCIHAKPETQDQKLLYEQDFNVSQRMKVEHFARIIEEIKGKAIAVSLNYLGDPYTHPDIDQLCAIANRAGLNVHLTTHFSYSFSDQRIASIAQSGVTHLTVCVDGATQESYEITRVGGRLGKVLSNREC